MSGSKYYSTSGTPAKVKFPGIPEGAYSVSAQIDESFMPNTLFCSCGWLKKDFTADGLIKHDTDEILFFAGCDPEDHENLHADISIRIENDVLVLKETCVVFVPAGVAHGELTVKNLTKPVFFYTCQTHAGTYAYENAEASAPAGTYAKNHAEKYNPPSGIMPGAPEGFLRLLMYLDGEVIPGAPYMETTWFCTVNETGPAPHAHKFDELIAFIGMDAENPADLGATVDFDFEGEYVTTDKSCLVYVPEGVVHSPILVPAMKTPILHFSIGRDPDYDRKGEDFKNEYKPEDR